MGEKQTVGQTGSDFPTPWRSVSIFPPPSPPRDKEWSAAVHVTLYPRKLTIISICLRPQCNWGFRSTIVSLSPPPRSAAATRVRSSWTGCLTCLSVTDREESEKLFAAEGL